MYIKNRYKNFQIFFIIIFLYTSKLLSQEQFLLNEEDMPGFVLKKQYEGHWGIGENKTNNTIIQSWFIEGVNDELVYIDYCQFDTAINAMLGTAYHAGNFIFHYFYGSCKGSILGDGAWSMRVIFPDSSGEISTIIVRGNVGIQIFKLLTSEKDQELLQSIAQKSINKIEANLSPDILSFENAARQKQIPMNSYQQISDPVIQSDIMLGFLESTTWDSKWLSDSTTLVMGRRTEWTNDSGTLIGIDICRFDTEEQAKQATDIQSQQTYSPIFDIDSLTSLQQIIDEWQAKPKFGMEENLFSVVSHRSNLAVHYYQFDSTKINTDFTYSVVAKLAEQIINF